MSEATPRWDVYQMPQGDWAFAAAGCITDGYQDQQSAMVACADHLADMVAIMDKRSHRLARMAEVGQELVDAAGEYLQKHVLAPLEFLEAENRLERAIHDFEEASYES